MTSARPSTPLKKLCVFCGSHPGTDPRHRQAAEALGRAMARRGVALVYGGSHCGLMGFLADAVLEGGGQVLGVMPQALVDMERAHRGLTELIITDGMHARKATMARLADAFLALPGGFGTLDEWCEIVTWSQLGFHTKPVGLLNSGGFWDGLLAFLAQGRDQGFIPPAVLEGVRCHAVPEDILDLLGV